MSGPGERVHRLRRSVRVPGWLLLGMAGSVLAAPMAGQDVVRLPGERAAIHNLAGHVRIVAGSGSEVVVRVMRGGRDADRLSVESGPLDGRETLRIRYPGDEIVYPELGRGTNTTTTVRPDGTLGGRRGRGGDRVRIRGTGDGLEAWADLVIEVPDRGATELHLAAGSVEARGTNGDLSIGTGAGAVSAVGVTGSLRIDTGSGRVEVDDIDGDVSVDTGSGAISGRRLTGSSVQLDTGSGSVILSGSDIDILSADSGSGGVRILDTRVRELEVDTGSGSIELELLEGLERVGVDTGSGSVTLRVPADFGAEVDIETGSGRIEVDLPVRTRTLRRNELSGVIGDGRGRITIDTGSGSVRVVSGG